MAIKKISSSDMNDPDRIFVEKSKKKLAMLLKQLREGKITREQARKEIKKE